MMKMMKKLRVLLIDDNPDDRALTIRELKKEFNVEIDEVSTQEDLKQILNNFNFDIVITDYNLQWSTGLEILNSIKQQYPRCPVIMFTGTGNEEIAVKAMKAGLDDYVVKTLKHFIRLPAAVKMVLDKVKVRQAKEHAERELHESEEKFRNIFDSSPNAITVTNLDGTIVECNQPMLELHGFSSKQETIGKSAFDLVIPSEKQRAHDNMKKTIQEGSIKNIEYIFLTKNGCEFPVELSLGVITDLAGKPVSLVSITKDITEEKRAEEEMKKRSMKYKLDNGKVYLTKENIPSLSLEAFKDLLTVGYFGLIISRIPEKDFKKIALEGDFEFLWLAERGQVNTLLPDLKELESKIENLPRKNVVLIDRIEYLIFKNGFNNTLTFIQHIRELAYLRGNIIILSLDPSILNNQELRLLEKECSEVQVKMDRRELPKELLKILRYIYEENKSGIKPSYNNIGQKLNISKPTVRKRIKELIIIGYIKEMEKGRNKVIDLTDMGRNLFFSRN